MTAAMPRIRLVHLSDIHVTARPLGWKRADWFNKRLAAWFNLRGLGRGYRFRHADRVMATLMAELHRSPPDRVMALARKPEVLPYSAEKLLVETRYS